MILSLVLALLVAPGPDAETLDQQAQALAAQKRYTEAEKLWQSALTIDPKFFPALFNLGYLYYSQGRFKDASGPLQEAANVNLQDFNSRYLLGATLSKLKDTDGALRAWRSALRLRPNYAKLLALLIVEYGKGRYFNEAADAARELLKLDPGDENTYYLAIKALADAGDTSAAQAVAGKAVERFPASARANFEYGFHLAKSGRTEEAIKYLKKSMDADPKYEEPPYFLGEVLFDLGKTEEAVPLLRQAIANRNDYVPARVLLSRALIKLGRWDEALTELQHTIEMEPSHPQPHLLLSQVLFRRGDEAGARQERELSLKLRREHPESVEALQGRRFTDR